MRFSSFDHRRQTRCHAAIYEPSAAIKSGATMVAVFGASLIGGLFQMVLGYFIPQLRRFIPALVSGVVVMTIGFTLLPVGIKYSAGCGAYPAPFCEQAGFGNALTWAMALFVVIIITSPIRRYARGVWSTSSIFNVTSRSRCYAGQRYREHVPVQLRRVAPPGRTIPKSTRLHRQSCISPESGLKRTWGGVDRSDFGGCGGLRNGPASPVRMLESRCAKAHAMALEKSSLSAASGAAEGKTTPCR